MTYEESLRRRIGQLLVFGFDGPHMSPTIADFIQRHHVGNVILFSRNVVSRAQLQSLTQVLQSTAREAGQDLPLTISCDQENGIVSRLPPDVPVLPGNMALGATADPQNAYASGYLTGQVLTHVGINFNLAPVLDVNNNPANPVIGVRSFSDNPQIVADFGSQYIRGLQTAGVIGCGKHFPGHGDTALDSHMVLPTITHARARLERLELVPFRAAISAGLDAIMTAHIAFPSADPTGVPATVSAAILGTLLRQELEFTGVITTDCLEMNAISQRYGVGPGAVRSLKAGADLVMVSHRADRQLEAIEAIVSAIRSGELSEYRIDEAHQRVSQMKQRRLNAPTSAGPEQPELEAKARALQTRLSEAAATPLKLSGPLPTSGRIAVLVDELSPVVIPADPQESQSLLAGTLRRLLPAAQIDTYSFPAVLDQYSAEVLLDLMSEYDAVVMGINGTKNTAYLRFIHEHLSRLAVPQTAFCLRNPYDATAVAQAHNIWLLYENTPWMIEAAVRGALGHPMGGCLPVTISSQYSRGYAAR